MINPVTPMSARITFGKIIEPDKDFYTERQQKLANYVKDTVNLTNPNDNKGRSYVDHLKQVQGLDLYIRAKKDTNSIELYSIDKNNTPDLIKNYKKGFKPKESDFSSYLDFLDEKKLELRDKIITFVMCALSFIVVAVMSNKGNNTNQLKQIAKKEIMHSAKDSANLTPSQAFKLLAK